MRLFMTTYLILQKRYFYQNILRVNYQLITNCY